MNSRDQKIQKLEFQLQCKQKEVRELKNKYDDLSHLFSWMEEEYKQMQYIVNGIHRIDSYIKES